MKSVFAAILMATLAAGILFVTGVSAIGQRDDKPAAKSGQKKKEASLWMKHKLAATQSVLEGMTSGDFDTIAKNAESMQQMSYLEEWVRSDIPAYKAELHAFAHANGAIVLAAKAKNLDGVTLGFNQLTISCVQCHKLVRDTVKQ